MQEKKNRGKPGLCLRIAAVCISMLTIVALLFGSLRHCVTKTDVFQEIYTQLDHAAGMGMQTEELVLASRRMIAYMEGSAPDIDIEVTIGGIRTQMFNDRERAHMVDVKVLYQNWRTAYYSFIGLYILLAAWMLLRVRADAPWRLARAFLSASGMLLCAGIVLGGWAALDFNAFWTAFHLLFFDNDLWLLDPATSRMINMMPLELFSGIAMRMAGRFVVIWGVLAAASAGVLAYGRRKARSAR